MGAQKFNFLLIFFKLGVSTRNFALMPIMPTRRKFSGNYPTAPNLLERGGGSSYPVTPLLATTPLT